MDNQSPNRNMRRRTDEQERRTKAQVRSNDLDGKSKRGKPLKCDRCDRLFLNEETLKYHTVMCNKTRVLGKKGERRTVKDFFPSDDDDDSINLLFFTEKNLELTSKKEIIASVEEKLGVSVTEFRGKEKLTDSEEPQKKRGRRKRATPTKPSTKKHAALKKEGNQVKWDCCIQGRKELEPIRKGKKSETCKASSSVSSASPCSSSSSSCSFSSSSSASSSGEEDGCETKKDILADDVKNPNLRGTTYFKDNYYILPFHQNVYKSMTSPPTQ